MSAELFKLMTHVPLLNITYRGMDGGAYTDMLSGRVQVAFDNLPGSVGYIRAGQFRALGVTTAARSEVLPDVPSISELPILDIRWQSLLSGRPLENCAVVIGRNLNQR